MDSSNTQRAGNASLSPRPGGVEATVTLKRLAAWDMLSDCGEMAERTKAPVSKTGISSGIVGSNPTLSARFEANISCNAFTPVIEVADKFRRVNAGVPPDAL